MTEREKLIEILGGMSGIAWSPSVRGIIADYLLANGVTVQKWIPVSERLPAFEDFEGCDKDNCYITVKRWDYENSCYKSSVSYAHWTGDYFTYGGGITGGEIVGVTHWMPLPEPPKEEV